MNDEPARDGMEAGLRFGCGSLLGGVALLSLVWWQAIDTSATFWIALGAGAIACGGLAVRFGDRAFRWMVDVLIWW